MNLTSNDRGPGAQCPIAPAGSFWRIGFVLRDDVLGPAMTLQLSVRSHHATAAGQRHSAHRHADC